MKIQNTKFIVYFSILFNLGIVNFAFAETKLFEKDLYFGLQGNSDVVRLQEFLTKEGLYNGPTNGNFYTLTQEGVKKYQKTNNIMPTSGYFGPITRALVNNKFEAVNIDKSAQIQALQSQINELLKQLSLLQSATFASVIPEQVTTTLIVPDVVAISTPEVIATITPALSSSFDSTLKIKSNWADYTLTRFSAVVLGEFSFNTDGDEKIAITKLRFKNVGTLVDDSIHDLRLLDSQTNEIISNAVLENGTATFSMTPDITKTNKGLVVSGKSYTLLADRISASTYGLRYTVEYDIQADSDISAFDYNDLSRVAKLKQLTFPIIGTYIKTY